ncbi:monovalent cation/H(+) antiporter subunit G [Thermosipho atlanticus]|uniref:Na+/H+ antiporter subunit n=1 Tax=Thermosipho atlanticus DSM 15807 TaxID=1123380 RepID=A0A1M5SQB7_9BACT|nr:monovalent cation/H(+) antiporter subunit G [Thermosipho atlanticus]SHH40630.1 Na+/H+ antiporter subunit [Thermosipho atlanticus DSM 15807]
MTLSQTILIYIGVFFMIVGNFIALKSKFILKKIHYLSAGDTVGGIFILIAIMMSSTYFSKSLLALIILLLGSPSITYFIANTLSKRGRNIGDS